MNFKTSDNSKWLDYESDQEFYANLDKSRHKEGLAPDIHLIRIKACMKALKMKTVKDLYNEDNLLHDHVLGILLDESQNEHSLICHHYKWSKFGNEIEKQNDDRLTLAGDLSYELRQIAELKKLAQGSKIYMVRHSDTKTKYYTYTVFYLDENNEPVTLNLKSFGFKFGVVMPDPYHNFVMELGQKIKGNTEYYKKVEL